MSKYRGNWTLKLVGVVALAVLVLGCETMSMGGGGNGPTLGQQAQAQGTAPVASQVATVSFPAEPSLPRYAVVIKPFEYSASGQQSGGGQAGPVANQIVEGDTVTSMSPDGSQIRTTISTTAGPDIGRGIAAQLRTALSGWPNISLLPPEAVTKNGDGTYRCKLQPGEVGPFVIEGIVTEFSETADASGSGGGVNLRTVGWGTALIGAITGSSTAMGVGAGVGVLGPEFKNAKMRRTGMVGMDLAVLDGRIARYVGGGTFKCQGSFTTVAAASKMSVLGISSGQSEVAASSLGNATRAALNDALQKTHDSLVTVR